MKNIIIFILLGFILFQGCSPADQLELDPVLFTEKAFKPPSNVAAIDLINDFLTYYQSSNVNIAVNRTPYQNTEVNQGKYLFEAGGNQLSNANISEIANSRVVDYTLEVTNTIEEQNLKMIGSSMTDKFNEMMTYFNSQTIGNEIVVAVDIDFESVTNAKSTLIGTAIISEPIGVGDEGSTSNFENCAQLSEEVEYPVSFNWMTGNVFTCVGRQLIEENPTLGNGCFYSNTSIVKVGFLQSEAINNDITLGDNGRRCSTTTGDCFKRLEAGQNWYVTIPQVERNDDTELALQIIQEVKEEIFPSNYISSNIYDVNSDVSVFAHGIPNIDNYNGSGWNERALTFVFFLVGNDVLCL